MLESDNGSPFERRSGVDRRSASTFPSLFSRYRRRRSKGRRTTDPPRYVDVYDRRSWGLVASVVALSLLDAILTAVEILAGNIEEANPVMNLTLSRGGIGAFFAVKAAMTLFPLAFILIHSQWNAARYAARVCLWCYIFVSVYHICLLSTHVGF